MGADSHQDGLTAEVKDTVTVNGVLQGVTYNIFSNPSDLSELGEGTDTVEDFLNEFAPVQVGVSKREEGFYVHNPVVAEPDQTEVDPKLRGDAIPRDDG